MAGTNSRAGVYLIRHRASGRRYVGSAVNIRKRWKEHRRGLDSGHHHSRFLQRAWAKHGPAAFEFVVALYCDRENLLMYEQRLLDGFKPEYNSAPVAGSQLGFRMSDESKAKLSAAAKRTRNFTGHRHSEETKRRISESRKGKGGGVRSLERRAKISAALTGRTIPRSVRVKIAAKLTGTSTGRGQLNADQVREVRRLRSEGLGQVRIARAMNITESAALAVIGGHAYGWVK